MSTIPTGIIGYLGKELVSNASDTLIIPGICLLVTAVLLFISDQMLEKNVDYGSDRVCIRSSCVHCCIFDSVILPVDEWKWSVEDGI